MRVRKVDSKKIVIQQIQGDKNEKVMKETVLEMDAELQKVPECGGGKEKDETKLIGEGDTLDP